LSKVARGNLFVIVAPSGAGKTSLVAALLEREANIRLSISFTTRAPREGEVHGREYHFIRRPEFERMIRRWIEDEISGDHDVLLEIDWQGAAQVRKLFPNVVGIFILPPSFEELRYRLQRRGKDSPEAIERRMSSAREEISHVLEFEYIIVNERFESALDDLTAIVRATRLSRVQQSHRLSKLIDEFK